MLVNKLRLSNISERGCHKRTAVKENRGGLGVSSHRDFVSGSKRPCTRVQKHGPSRTYYFYSSGIS